MSHGHSWTVGLTKATEGTDRLFSKSSAHPGFVQMADAGRRVTPLEFSDAVVGDDYKKALEKNNSQYSAPNPDAVAKQQRQDRVNKFNKEHPGLSTAPNK